MSQAAQASRADSQSHGEILKSSTLVGGPSAVNIAIGIVRTKVMARLLGPAGVGLMGLYASIAGLARSIAGMGINSSGVEQIAEAVGSADTKGIGRTVTVLRRPSMLLGYSAPRSLSFYPAKHPPLLRLIDAPPPWRCWRSRCRSN
jgi:O-antigen/teichoic acid export membrane protein